LCGFYPRLKFVLAQLGDNLAFRDGVSLLAGLFDHETGYLECHLDLLCRFDLSRKRTHGRFIRG
jgi:hypothetical protein